MYKRLKLEPRYRIKSRVVRSPWTYISGRDVVELWRFVFENTYCSFHATEYCILDRAEWTFVWYI